MVNWNEYTGNWLR